MSEAFLKAVNMSISAGWLVLVVLALRLILKKAPKWVNVLLWGIVAIRLICPFSIESGFSLMPEWLSSGALVHEWTDDYIGHNHFINDASDYYDDAISAGREPISDGEGGYYVATGTDKISDPSTIRNTVVPKLAIVWGVGMSLMAVYTVVSFLSLRRKLRTAVILRDNIFQCETVSSPFVLGILKPRIYLPYAMDGQNLHHVVAHEQAHIRRKDHWWKPLGFLLLTVYWFNPLMWVAYILLCRDIELACDEKVIAELGNEQRADYTQALVACAVNRRMIAACPLAFGEVGVKDRIKSIMNYRKPAFWIIVTALVVCLVVAVCFLTDPNPSREFSMNGNHVSGLDPEAIVDRILDIEDWESSNVYVNASNFTLMVDSGFNWVDSQTICYFFSDASTTYSAQLRIFPDEDLFLITESAEWTEQKYRYLLRHYLEAIKYLPQEEIRQMAPADRYQIEFIDRGRPSDYERLITYTAEGVCELSGWYIHLRILPFHESGDAYSGAGDEVLDLFYGQSDESAAGYIRLDDSLEYYLTIPCEDVHQIEIVTENSSGGCVNADGSCFRKGERVYLEQLDGMTDLRGINIVAYDRQGVILNVISIPASEYTQPVNAIAEHGWFLAPEGADIDMLNIAAPDSDDAKEMVPTDTDLLGLQAGALLLPIDGDIYRYLLTDNTGEGVTADECIFEFKEPDLNRTIEWKVYSLKEYPDLSVVMILSKEEGPWLCTYSPPGRCSDTALSDAINAGYVVMEEGVATHGQDVWKSFFEDAQKGKAAFVIVAHYQTLDPERCDTAYFEAFNQDYPYLNLYHLTFDGTVYTLSFTDSGLEYTRTYEYLIKYEASGTPLVGNTEHKRIVHYALTHDATHTWEDLWGSLASSVAGAAIDFYPIYAESVN